MKNKDLRVEIVRALNKEKKIYRILIHGDNMYDKGYANVIEIEAENLKSAIKIAYDQNGVYDAEPAEEYDEDNGEEAEDD